MQFNDGFKNLVLHPLTIFFLVHGESDFLDFEAGLFGYSHVKSKNFHLEWLYLSSTFQKFYHSNVIQNLLKSGRDYWASLASTLCWVHSFARSPTH